MNLHANSREIINTIAQLDKAIKLVNDHYLLTISEIDYKSLYDAKKALTNILGEAELQRQTKND